MFLRVLICTDLTDGLQRFLQVVPALAAGGIQSITVLHTLPLPNEQIPRPDVEKTREVRDRLQSLLSEVPDGMEVNLEVTSGKAIDTILAAVKTHRADLLIMGMPSRSMLNEKLFGSTTMGVCQRLTIPLLTFRPELVATLTSEELDLRCRHLFQQVLIPYDGSAAGNYLVQQVKQTFQTVPVSSLKYCYLYTVVDEVSRNELLRESNLKTAQQQLEPARAELAGLGIQVSAEVRQGNAVVQVLAAAQEEGVSAIALASDSLGKLREWSSPSFAGEILRRSWHPVLYFPVLSA